MPVRSAPKVELHQITALVLAAGYSSRMVDFKPLLKFGAKTVVERVVSVFMEAGILDVRVITGHRQHDLEPLLERLGVRWTRNENYKEGMFSSVRAGLIALEEDQAGFFVMPVDVALVRSDTILELFRAFQESSKRICYPNFSGRRGHPPLISTKYREEILQWDKPGGLGAFLKQKQSHALDVQVSDEAILLDMDTQEDYKNLLRRLQQGNISSDQ